MQVAADARKQWRRRTWGMSVLGLPMVPPASKIHQRWVLFDISLDALYSCLLLPISLALGTSTIRLTWAAVMDVLAGAGFIFSALMSLHIGFYITHNFRRRLIMDGWESFMYYMRSVRFIIDLLTVVQLLVQIAGLVSPSQAMEDATTVTRTIRLLRLFHFVVETFFAANRCPESSATPPLVFLVVLHPMPRGRCAQRCEGLACRYDPNSTYWPRWIGRRTQYFLLMGFNSFVVTNFVGCVLLAGARVENPSLQNTWVDYNGFIDLSPASQVRAKLCGFCQKVDWQYMVAGIAPTAR